MFERKVHEIFPAGTTRFETLYELFREKAVHENRLYHGGVDMHFNDEGFRFLAKEFADWVIQNPVKSIGLTPDDKSIMNN